MSLYTLKAETFLTTARSHENETRANDYSLRIPSAETKSSKKIIWRYHKSDTYQQRRCILWIMEVECKLKPGESRMEK